MNNKYRVWDKLAKKWLYPYPKGFNIFGECTCFSLIEQSFHENHKEMGLLEFLNNIEIVTYTGEIDQSGLEIYEGDLFEDVLNTDKIGVVKYGKYINCFDRKEVLDYGGHVGFFVDFKDDRIRKDLQYWAKNSLIIGNIYENKNK